MYGRYRLRLAEQHARVVLDLARFNGISTDQANRILTNALTVYPERRRPRWRRLLRRK
jgi:hypothetical protein